MPVKAFPMPLTILVTASKKAILAPSGYRNRLRNSGGLSPAPGGLAFPRVVAYGKARKALDVQKWAIPATLQRVCEIVKYGHGSASSAVHRHVAVGVLEELDHVGGGAA